MATQSKPPVAQDPRSAAIPGVNGGSEFHIPPEAIPDYDKIVIEDNAPVESVFAEKQYRLLTESLYSSWPGPGDGRSFAVFSNVGLFVAMKEPPVVPDVMLSLDMQIGDQSQREHNSYFIWVVGKAPDVVFELISDRRGGEEGKKKTYYARAGVPYYVIFDPDKLLGSDEVRVLELCVKEYKARPDQWLPKIGLGVKIWEGTYEDLPARWLRWCDTGGHLIPTAVERIGQERDRADRNKERMERLEAQLRALGQEPTA